VSATKVKRVILHRRLAEGRKTDAPQDGQGLRRPSRRKSSAESKGLGEKNILKRIAAGNQARKGKHMPSEGKPKQAKVEKNLRCNAKKKKRKLHSGRGYERKGHHTKQKEKSSLPWAPPRSSHRRMGCVRILPGSCPKKLNGYDLTIWGKRKIAVFFERGGKGLDYSSRSFLKNPSFLWGEPPKK